MQTQTPPKPKLLIRRFVLKPLALIFFIGLASQVSAIVDQTYVSFEKKTGSFGLSVNGQPASLYISARDHDGAILVMQDFKKDLTKVSGREPQLDTAEVPESSRLVIAGTIGKSPVIDKLIENNKIDVSDIKGKWEATLTQIVDNPVPGVNQALVIAGSDKRGTIYGLYDLSEQMGVSPWNWWADVPAASHPDVYVNPERRIMGDPDVKYRGIFLNDEEPALGGWVREKFGGFNHQFYEKVFKLILRMKGNFLWPAMWGKAFYDDDSLNAVLADKYGVVISTSHHEPLMRAHVEWSRYGEGPWNYQKNDSILREFWRKGIQRMGSNESVVTLGMRGDGDKPMSEESNIELLERIVEDQRGIIKEETGKELSEVPQVWALYKEVQEYYDKGMEVPEDVTLLFSDDNWGNIRRLPKPQDTGRAGGFGIYYHFDYVGGPRSYRWINKTQISRVWEQMHLAYQHKARRIWVVNVGDLKPMEFPIQFFLDYAWDPQQWPAERLPEYTRLWAQQQFGSKYADPIADFMTKYTRFNSRRTAELLSPDTYSLIHYNEAERVVEEYNKLKEEAWQIYEKIPVNHKPAYYQLVLYPIEASANLNEMYVNVAQNHLYANQGRAEANDRAEKARQNFALDAKFKRYYNKAMLGGKWDHMMDQIHIGYTSWNEPPESIMPEVKEFVVPEKAEMGVAIEGSEKWWPEATAEAVLPAIDIYQKQSRYIEVFNRGTKPFEYTVDPGEDWIRVEAKKERVDNQDKIYLSADWDHVPKGNHRVPVTLESGNGEKVTVYLEVRYPDTPKPRKVEGFVESNGYVSMEAPHYTQAVNTNSINWQVIPNLGRTHSAVTPLPVTAESQEPGGNSPHLQYKMHLFSSGTVTVKAFLSPTLNYHDTEGLRFAVSIDDQKPVIVNMHKNETHQDWQGWVSNNVNVASAELTLDEPGEHTLKYWMVDPGVVLQKIVIDAGGLEPSYLGPPESFYRKESKGLF